MHDAISTGLVHFAELLNRLSPRHRQKRQPCQLEPDAPRRVREFWEAVGWSDAVGAGGETPRTLKPDRSASMQFMESLFEAWFDKAEVRDRWGVEPGDFSAAWKRLPSRFRVVVSSDNLPELSDESTPSEDPPLYELKMSQGQLVPQPDRYLGRLIRSTLQRVMTERKASTDSLPPRGSQPLGAAFPGLWELAEGIWGLDADPRAPARAGDGIHTIFYESFERYIDFALSQSPEQLPRLRNPTGCTFLLKPTDTLEPRNQSEPGFRRYEYTSTRPMKRVWQNAVGRIEGRGAWLLSDGKTPVVRLIVAPEHYDATLAWLKRHKHKLHETPERPSPPLWATANAP